MANNTTNKMPKMYDVSLLIQAGIDPKTGLPIKAMSGTPCTIKDDIKRQLRIIDEQDAVNRFKWTNLPCNMTSQELERLIYYKGQLCFFYLEETDEYYFMPYALDGTIDFYGRFNSVHPVPMSSGTTEDDTAAKAQADFLSTKNLKCIYTENDKKITEGFNKNEVCVLLHDYTKQLAQTIIPRQIVNDTLLDVMADTIPLTRTALIIGTGIKGMRVNDADQQNNVKDASNSMYNSALTGKPWVPIIGNIEFQELTDGGTVKPESFLQAYQSFDNIRLQTYGLENGGAFQKKAHVLQSENDTNMSNGSIIMEDGLEIRKHFCDLVNSIFNLNISVEQNQVQTDVAGEAFNDEGGDDYEENNQNDA